MYWEGLQSLCDLYASSGNDNPEPTGRTLTGVTLRQCSYPELTQTVGSGPIFGLPELLCGLFRGPKDEKRSHKH